MTALVALFWSAAILVAYTYFLFPLLLFLRGIFTPRSYASADLSPHVSLIIAAYNEASVIAAKLDNILALDYPRDRLEVLVVSDGSDDGTNEIVRGYAGRGVKLLALPRQGKAAALNAAVAAASGEILVFSDANSMYASDAILALVRPFADAQVGGVAGNQRYLSTKTAGPTDAGEKSYWGFDRKLKQFQSRAGHTTSATGAIYAIRRHLFRSVPAGVTDDFVISTYVIAQGYRLVFAPDAVAYESVATKSNEEWMRKVRVITRGLRAVILMRELLNPFRYGFYSLQLFSHKVLRRFMVFPHLILLVVSPLLWRRRFLYRVATVGQLGFYSLGLLGMWFNGRSIGRFKLFTIPFYFCMVNIACLLAVWNVIRGRRIERWEPRRERIYRHAEKN